MGNDDGVEGNRDLNWLRELSTSRRRFLGGLSLSALGVLAGCDSGRPGASPSLPTGSATSPRLGATGPSTESSELSGAKAGRLSLASRLPYTLSSDVSLSEDHYLLKLHQIDPINDIVMAYSRNDGEVEALLLQQGSGPTVEAVLQVYRDPTTTGGWNTRAVPNTAGATDMVAGMAAPIGWNAPAGAKQLQLWYRDGEHVFHVAQDAGGTWSMVGTPLAWPSSAGPLQLSYNSTGDLFAFCVQDASAVGKMDARLFYDLSKTLHYGPSNSDFRAAGTLTGFEFHSAGNARYPAKAWRCGANALHQGWEAQQKWGTAAFIDLWVPTSNTGVGNGGQTEIAHFLWPVVSPDQVSGTMINQTTGWNPQLLDIPGGDYVVAVDYVLATADLNRTAVIRTAQGNLRAITLDMYENNQWWVTSIPTPPAGPGDLRWEPALTPSAVVGGTSTALLELFIQLGDMTYVVRQYDQLDPDKNRLHPLFYPPVPLQNGVRVVATQAAPSLGNELVVVGLAGGLQYLLRDPVSGTWTGSDIHLPATEPLEVSTYRVRLSLADNWGHPVAGANLAVRTQPTQVTDASGKSSTVEPSPATVLVNGQALVLDDTPTLITTAADGTAVLALVATGTSAPPLSITTGGQTGPLVVYPSAPINTYLGGSGTLNTLPPMSSTTLKQATNSSSLPLAPGATGTTNGTSNADQAVKVFAAAAAAGAPPNALMGTRGGLSAGLGTRPTNLSQTIRVGDAQVTLEGLADDILQGIKFGAATVEWVAIDAATKVVTIAGDFATAALNFTVQTIEEAGHAFHSVINFLAAKIDEFVDWLKAQILSVLSDAVAVAKTFDIYATNLCGFAQKQLARGKGKTDTWFSQQETNITNAFAILAQQVGNTTLTGLQNQPAQFASSRGRPQLAAASHTADSTNAANGTHGQWLLEKITSLAPHVADPVPIPDTLLGKFDDVKAKLGSAGTDLSAAAEGVVHDILSGISNPKQLLSTGLPDLINKIGQLVKGLTEVAQAIVDAVFDLLDVLFDMWSTALNAKMGSLPLIGPLVESLDASFADMTVGQFAALVAAFPFVIAWKIKYGDSATVPFTSLSSQPEGLTTPGASRGELGLAPTADAWNILAGIVTIILGINDSFAASFSVPDSYGPADSPPEFCSVFDIAWPALLIVCAYPNADDRGVFAQPIDVADDASIMRFVSWIMSVVPPLVATFSLAVDKSGSYPLKGVSSTLVNYSLGIFGLSATVIGAVSCHLSNERNGEIWALQFTSNLSAVASFLLTPPLQSSPVWGELAVLACCLTILVGDLVSGILMFVAEPY